MHGQQLDGPDEQRPADLEAPRDCSEPIGSRDTRPRSFVGDKGFLRPPQRVWTPSSFTGFTQDRDQQGRPMSTTATAAAATSRNQHAWMLAHTRAHQHHHHQNSHDVTWMLDARTPHQHNQHHQHHQDPREVLSSMDSQRRDGSGGSNNDETRRPQRRWGELGEVAATETWTIPAFVADGDRSMASLRHHGRYFPDYSAPELPIGSDRATGASERKMANTWPDRSNQQPHPSHVSLLNEVNLYEQKYEDANDNDDEDLEDEEDETEVSTTSSVPKASRYLREMDRRVILERLARGEKQAALAKEFHVSRAAICNLFKHRHEVLARGNENPFAKHPKKKKKKHKATKPSNHTRERAHSESTGTTRSTHAPSAGATSMSGSPRTSQSCRSADTMPVFGRSPVGTLYVIKSVALPLLLSAISDRSRSLADFRRNSERVFWLILEEALALVPAREVRPELQETGQAEVRYEIESPPCAISMEPQAINATPLLDIFQLMEPQQPSGIATITTQHDSLTVEITDGDRLPHSLRGYNVFLLDVVAASGEAVCAAIEKLLRELGALEANVSVVALFTSSEVVAMVQCKYPLAKILTARIDSSITRRRIVSTPVDLILHRVRATYGAPNTTRIGARA